jgi:hypothetical protein
MTRRRTERISHYSEAQRKLTTPVHDEASYDIEKTLKGLAPTTSKYQPEAFLSTLSYGKEELLAAFKV